MVCLLVLLWCLFWLLDVIFVNFFLFLYFIVISCIGCGFDVIFDVLCCVCGGFVLCNFECVDFDMWIGVVDGVDVYFVCVDFVDFECCNNCFV